MKIHTEDQFYGWVAVDEDTYDGAPDSHCPIGTGRTEQEAIEDLLEQMELRAEDAA